MNVGASSAVFFELEVAAAGFVGHFTEPAIGLAPHHALAVEVIALEPDRVDHHFFGARAIDHAPEADPARGVVAVGEHENHAAPFNPLQFVERCADRVPEARAVPVVEILHVADQLVAVVREMRAEPGSCR